MKILMIVACDKNGVIGKNNQLPWYLPEDLKYFKKRTTGYPVIMGRKTFESIGKPLPNRENIILTRDTDYTIEGCKIIHSTNELMFRSDVGFVIGGAEVFNQFMSIADKLFITRIDHEFGGDTYFQELGDEWKLVESTQGIKDEKNPYDYFFEVYHRSK
ncbi:MAG: dihydrofolate reductase [Bacillales bacterium]|jgi:dihydrofolate reductase|nr:dihydrofolate reductase [Bacillales bacterium]